MIQIKPISEYDLEMKSNGLELKPSFIGTNKALIVELSSNEVLPAILHDLNAITIQLTMQGKIPLEKGRAYCDCIADIERIIFNAGQYANTK